MEMESFCVIVFEEIDSDRQGFVNLKSAKQSQIAALRFDQRRF